MEYIYGTNQNLEILKTVGDSHTDLSGFFETRREYADGTVITDHCRILDHFHSAEQGGVCYDWYTIDSHYRNIEKDAATYAEMAAAIREGVNSVD